MSQLGQKRRFEPQLAASSFALSSPHGAADPRGDVVESDVRFFAQPTCHHAPEVYSAVGETEAAGLLREFFRARR
jgi:hypothetical protein